MATAWSFLTLEADERQFRGNTGYEDDLARHYSWDQTVPNYSRIREGDLAVLRDSDYVLGVGWIDKVLDWTSDKDRFRCPNTDCRRTGFKERKTLAPRYKCAACGNEFDVPDVEHLKGITFFRADYRRTWRPLDAPMPVAAIAPAYLREATQHAIRELDLVHARTLIDGEQPMGDFWWASGSEKGTKLPGGHTVFVGRARIGQQRFRQEMLSRFGPTCAVSGPLPPAMLEAAHLYRYAERPQHQLDGGLLLRRDLHALFDRNLLLVDPDDGWRVRLAPNLVSYPQIWCYDGVNLSLKPGVRPNAIYLREHAALARAVWHDIAASA